MYRQFNQKVNQNTKLKEEIEHLRRNYNNKIQQDMNRNVKE